MKESNIQEIHITKPLIVRPSQVAKLLGCSIATVWNLVKDESDDFPKVVHFGRNMCGVPYEDLVSWLERKKQSPKKQSAQ